MIIISNTLISEINNEVLREAEKMAAKSDFIPANVGELQDLEQSAFFLALIKVGERHLHLISASDHGQRDATRP